MNWNTPLAMNHVALVTVCLLGAGLSRQVLEYPGGLGALETVNDDFDSPMPATDAERDAVRPQSTALGATRLNALLGFRRVSFVVRENLDGVRAVQDVQVGSEGVLAVGRSVGFLGPSDDADDIHARFDLFTGVAGESLVRSGDASIRVYVLFQAAQRPACRGTCPLPSDPNHRATLHPVHT